MQLMLASMTITYFLQYREYFIFHALLDDLKPLTDVLTLLGRSAPCCAKVACSHFLQPPVDLCIFLVHCGKMIDRIWVRFGMVGRMVQSRHEAGSWVWGSVHGRG